MSPARSIAIVLSVSLLASCALGPDLDLRPGDVERLRSLDRRLSDGSGIVSETPAESGSRAPAEPPIPPEDVPVSGLRYSFRFATRTGAIISPSVSDDYRKLLAELEISANASGGRLDFNEQAITLARYGGVFARLARENAIEPRETLEFSWAIWDSYVPFVADGPIGWCSSPVPGEYSPPCVFVQRKTGRVEVPDIPLGWFSGMLHGYASMAYGVWSACGWGWTYRLLDSSLSVVSEIVEYESGCDPVRTKSFARKSPVSGSVVGRAVTLVFASGSFADAATEYCEAAWFSETSDDFPNLPTIPTRGLRIFERPLGCSFDIDASLLDGAGSLHFVFD